MTKELYLNVVYSLRYFFRNIDSDIRWYLDSYNERMTEDEFVEVLTTTRRSSDDVGRGAIWSDFANVNVYSKTDVASLVATIVDAIPDMIPIYDFVNNQSDNVIGYIIRRRVEVNRVPPIEGYQVQNVSLYYDVTERM